MHLSFFNFEKNLDKFFLYEKKPKIAVGVSGGPDSIALTHLLFNWIIKKNGDLIALIIDHKIRKESLLESLKTKNYLSSKGIKSKILFVSKKKVGKGKLSQARTNRFEKLLNYCKKENFFHLFLGHHFDDNLETFILRKIAGSNFEGLNSMQFLSVFNNIQVIRPLLIYKKNDILLYNSKQKLNYINDPSNFKTKYSRVAIREHLSSDVKLSNEIYKEFALIKKNNLKYKKMIYQLLNFLIIDLKLKKIIINAKFFFKLNYEIEESILIKCIKYVNNLDHQIRYKKIGELIKKISQYQVISFRLSNILIYRNNDKITITKI